MTILLSLLFSESIQKNIYCTKSLEHIPKAQVKLLEKLYAATE